MKLSEDLETHSFTFHMADDPLFTCILVLFIHRSLFKADRLMFAVHMVHGMYPDQFRESEWELFTGLIVSDIKSDGQKHDRDLPQWIEQERSPAVSLLKSTLPNVYSSLALQV